MIRNIIIAVIALCLSGTALAQQSINNDTIVKMAKAGLSDDVIVSTINASPGKYDASPDGLIALKTAGVGDKAIAAIVAKSAELATNNSGNPAPSSPADVDEGTSHGSHSVSAGARVVIAPMG